MYNKYLGNCEMDATEIMRLTRMSDRAYDKGIVREVYLKYVEDWVRCCFHNEDKSKVDVLVDRILKFVENFKLYNNYRHIFNININPQSLKQVPFCFHHSIKKIGTSVAINMVLSHLGSRLNYTITFFINNPEEVMFHLTKVVVCDDDHYTIDYLHDASKAVYLNPDLIYEKYNQSFHNIEMLLTAKDAYKYLVENFKKTAAEKEKKAEEKGIVLKDSKIPDEELEVFTGEKLLKLYFDKLGAALYNYMDKDKRADFVKVDKHGKIVGFKTKEYFDKHQIDDSWFTGDDKDDRNQQFNEAVNDYFYFNLDIVDAQLIPIEGMYKTISQTYIDNLLMEAYDIYAFLSQNNCTDEKTMLKVAQLITKHNNHKIDFIDYLKKKFHHKLQKEDLAAKSEKEMNDMLVKELTKKLGKNAVIDNRKNKDDIDSMDDDDRIEHFVKMVNHNEPFDRAIGCKQLGDVLYGETNAAYTTLNDSIVYKKSTLKELDHEMNVAHRINDETQEAYYAIRRNYGIHCTVNSMFAMFTGYIRPINDVVYNTYQGIKAFENFNYAFDVGGDDDDVEE